MKVARRFAIWILLAWCDLLWADPPRPNIVWITAEDMSPHLGCYEDPQARTPCLDALALQSVRYTNAFATAPVCSPARSCLITGMYATSLGTQRLRSQFSLPDCIRPFPAWLRDAGYYCTNNVKTDYNVRDEAAFIRAAWNENSDAAHWRGRRKDQPFFAVFNFMTTHQSRTNVWPREMFEKDVGSRLERDERHNPAKLTLPPYYPDTPEARRTWARYLDCILVMDKQVGAILDQLAADALDEDTIVFFFSDHGMGLPRGKRCLHDSGMRVPLLVRVPAKWRHLAAAPAGSTNNRLVSFVDFAPTVLSLCGINAPAHFQGTAFLGSQAESPREYVYGARDRVDEAFDLARSVRNQRWLYIRNFMPHLSWMQPERFSDGSLFRRELKQLAAEGKLNAAAMTYAAPRRPREELYDTQADPHQLHNQAEEPQYAQTLAKLGRELHRWQLETRDAGLLTEPQMWTHMQAGSTPWSIAREDTHYPLERLLEVAGTVGDDDAAMQQIQAVGDKDDGIRYWAAVGLHARMELRERERIALRRALHDPSAVVRIEAAAALAKHDEAGIALPVLAAALADESPEVVLHAARALELLGPAAQPAHPQMRAALSAFRPRVPQEDMAMFIVFSLEASLTVDVDK